MMRVQTETIKSDLLKGNTQAAADLCNSLLDQEPNDGEIWHLYGLVYVRLEKVDCAVSALRTALSLQPGKDSWWRNLGLVLQEKGELQEALSCFRRAAELLPESPDNLWNLGRALFENKQFEKSVKILSLCVAIDPSHLRAWHLSARCHSRVVRPDKEVECLEHCVALAPDNPRFVGWLAAAYCNSGAVEMSLSTYDRAISLDSSNSVIASSKLGVILHRHGLAANFVRNEHHAWAQKYCPPPSLSRRQGRERGGLLRIGYVATEFVVSPSNHFLHPWLSRHDPTKFEVFFYHMAPQSDSMTQIYQKLCRQWREASHMNEDELDNQIRLDGIDILVDLTGHFDQGEGLSVFARRPAPVQITYPNYPCTTGVSEIDYILTDRFTCPEGNEEQYVETPYFLPSGYIIYEPREDSPPITQLPALSNGFVTFGMFQRPAKTNLEFWRTVSQVLLAVPESRILISFAARELEDIAGNFISRGIASELRSLGILDTRIQFEGICGFREHMKLVASCDIALDTFPYNGQTTTCECLWMGVPVVTLSGQYHVGMIAAGILQRVGLPEWVASDLPDYVNIAKKGARDLQALSGLRQSMRARLMRSPLMDADTFVRDVELAYQWICRQNSNGANSSQCHAKANS